MKLWIKGALLSGVLILLPSFFFGSAISNWQVWYLFLMTMILIGTEPNVAYLKMGSGGTAPKDRSSVIWIVTAGYVSVLAPLSHYLFLVSRAEHPMGNASYIAALIGAMGLALRVISIRILGKFFTARVEIQDDHVLCERGLYRWIRHPSYTGALAFFLTIPLVFGVWLWMIPIGALWAVAYSQRIRAEETALQERFGPKYDEYRKRTCALIPGIY